LVALSAMGRSALDDPIRRNGFVHIANHGCSKIKFLPLLIALIHFFKVLVLKQWNGKMENMASGKKLVADVELGEWN
jgi:hypothetical protein